MSLYKRPDSETWWVNISVPGQPRLRVTTGETDRVQAQRFHDQKKAELWLRPKGLTGKTWGAAVLKWMEVKDPSYNELSSISRFNQFFPDRMVASITADMIELALTKFCKTPATFNRHRARVLGILDLSGLAIKLPQRKVKEVERDWLTPEQWDKLRAELPSHMLPMATFALATGLRQANVLGLQWSRVDLKAGRMWVSAADAKGKKAIGIPLSIEAINVLKTVQGQHPEFCFTYKGHPVGEIKTAFMSACVRAGVGHYRAGKYRGFTWHGFRHTFATWHFQAGTPDAIIQQLGAWKTASMLDKYRHHSVRHLADYVNNTTKGKT